MSIRGYVLDIFPISEENPIRIEFWGDEIDSIRVFDVDTQLTIDDINSITIKPNTEEIIPNYSSEIKHHDLPKYIDVSNLSTYLENPILFFNNYHDIEVDYKLLLEEMLEYSTTNNIKDTSYMNELDKIYNNDTRYFTDFDENIDESLTYNSVNIEPFKGNKDYINKRLNDYVNKYDIVIICVVNRYQANKIIYELDNNIVFTNIDELVFKRINVIVN